MYFHEKIEPLVDKNMDYVREPRHRLVIPEINTDTIFD